MAEWLIEHGIGEVRAALVESDTILIGTIERPAETARVGAVLAARYAGLAAGGRAAQLTLEGGGEAFIDSVPPGIGPGARLRVEIVREAFPAGRRAPKRAKAVVVPDATPLRDGPTLAERLASARAIPTIGPDPLEAAGWSELIEEAASGRVTFPGGQLTIEQTEAFITIDVDGDLAPAALAVAGAAASARAIARLGLAGSIVIDLPTTPDREGRQRAAAAFDAAWPAPAGPVERTAVNGWGLLQVIRPRLRPSLMEVIEADPPRAALLALIRRAEREPPGPIQLTVAPALMAVPGREAAGVELAHRRGGAVAWRVGEALPIWGGHVHVARGA